MRQYKSGLKKFLGNRKSGPNRAQAILDFTAAAVVFIMLAYGMVQILRWAPKMLYEKTNQHDKCMSIQSGANMTPECMGPIWANSLDATMK